MKSCAVFFLFVSAQCFALDSSPSYSSSTSLPASVPNAAQIIGGPPLTNASDVSSTYLWATLAIVAVVGAIAALMLLTAPGMKSLKGWMKMDNYDGTTTDE